MATTRPTKPITIGTVIGLDEDAYGAFLSEVMALRQRYAVPAVLCAVFDPHGARIISTGMPGAELIAADTCARFLNEVLIERDEEGL